MRGPWCGPPSGGRLNVGWHGSRQQWTASTWAVRRSARRLRGTRSALTGGCGWFRSVAVGSLVLYGTSASGRRSRGRRRVPQSPRRSSGVGPLRSSAAAVHRAVGMLSVRSRFPSRAAPSAWHRRARGDGRFRLDRWVAREYFCAVSDSHGVANRAVDPVGPRFASLRAVRVVGGYSPTGARYENLLAWSGSG